MRNSVKEKPATEIDTEKFLDDLSERLGEKLVPAKRRSYYLAWIFGGLSLLMFSLVVGVGVWVAEHGWSEKVRHVKCNDGQVIKQEYRTFMGWEMAPHYSQPLDHQQHIEEQLERGTIRIDRDLKQFFEVKNGKVEIKESIRHTAGTN